MESTIAFAAFDLLGMGFLLWCLVNFYGENRRYKGGASVVRVGPVPEFRTANVVSMSKSEGSQHNRQRMVTLRKAVGRGRARRG